MKTLRILLAGAVALMAFAGCENSDELVDDTPVYDDAYYASYASISSSDSNFTSNSTGGTIHFKVSGGEVRLSVSCGTEWTLQNSNPDSFNAYASDSRYLTVSAEQNYVEEELTGTITLMTAGMHITFASITVTQNAYGAPEITVSTNEWNAPAVGNLTIMITVESDAEWTFEGGNEWLTIEKSGTGLNLTAKENEDTEGRETKIVLTCTDGYKSDSETITVTQDGRAYLTVSEESLEFDSNGGEAVVIVESNFEWEYICDSDWLSIEKDEEDGSLKITCDASEVEEDREGIVTFTAGDGASNITEVGLPIAQGAYLMPKITVETEEWNAPAVGELTTEIGVESTYEWTFETGASWLAGEKTETGIKLTAAQNSETAERTAEVVLTCTDDINSASKTIKVTQDGAAYITISDEELTFSVLESSTSISVESNYDLEYTCDSDWVTVAQGSPSKYLRITCLTNYDFSSREAVLTFTAGDGAENVTEKELKIIQEGCVYEEAFILRYDFSGATDLTVQLPLSDVTYAIINWGDGEFEAVRYSYPSHTYSSQGIYTVTVNGVVGHIQSSYTYRSPGSSRDSAYYLSGSKCLTAVVQWGELGLTDMSRGFDCCYGLASLPEGPGPFSNVTSFSSCFQNCSFRELPVGIFQKCTEVTTFSGAFFYCSSLVSVPEDLFSNCTLVTNFYSTFLGCTELEGESPYNEINVDGETVKVHLYERANYPDYFTAPTSYDACFNNCTKLDDYSDIPSSWK